MVVHLMPEFPVCVWRCEHGDPEEEGSYSTSWGELECLETYKRDMEMLRAIGDKMSDTAQALIDDGFIQVFGYDGMMRKHELKAAVGAWLEARRGSHYVTATGSPSEERGDTNASR